MAKECKRNNVQIPAANEYGYDAEFYAEGIYHHVGFEETLRYLKIDNGGFCGPIDFYTNGEDIFGQHEETGNIVQATAEDMRKFLKEFPVFEAAFYKWIESLQEE